MTTSIAQRGLIAAATFVVGFLGSVQVIWNTRAGQHFGIGIFGTVLSFGGGWLLLCVLVAIEAARRPGKPLRWRARPRWYLLMPGVLGVTFVTAGIFLTPVLGVLMYVVASIAGQLIGGAALDHRAGHKLTASKVGTLLLALCGALLTVIDRLRLPDIDMGVLIGCVLASLFVGMLMPVQAALNRAASQQLPSRLQATWWSFACGTAACCAVLAIFMGVQHELLATWPARFASSKWFHYLGGPLGVLYIASTIWLMPLVGAAVFFVALVSGQLTGSAVLDEIGSFDMAVVEVTPLRIAGILILLLAAALLQLQSVAICKRATAQVAVAPAPTADNRSSIAETGGSDKSLLQSPAADSNSGSGDGGGDGGGGCDGVR